MRKLPIRAAVLVFIAAGVAGCSQIGVLKAQLAFKDANQLYQRQDYKGAAAKYEEAVAANPDLGDAYFFLANSYDQQYRPTRRGEPENDQLIEKAIANYKIAVQKGSTEPTNIRKLSLQYLVNAYGADKLNDPSQQEPILRQMIEMDPTDVANYSVLANVYEQSGDYEQAEQLLIKAREIKPNDPAVYTSLANFYNRQGDFEKTMEALHARAEKEPDNPEAFYIISTYYWDKANKDYTVPQPERVKFVQEGYKAVDRALELKPDYPEALTYKGLLLRQEALLIKDPARQQQLVKEADTYRDRAMEIQKKQRATGAAE
jgi:tetratricopeptide (TPR) repeat protein